MAIPFAPAGAVVRSYKVMPRAENAHAYVNATFSMTVDSDGGFSVTDSPSLVFGGIGTHAVSYAMEKPLILFIMLTTSRFKLVLLHSFFMERVFLTKTPSLVMSC